MVSGPQLCTCVLSHYPEKSLLSYSVLIMRLGAMLKHSPFHRQGEAAGRTKDKAGKHRSMRHGSRMFFFYWNTVSFSTAAELVESILVDIISVGG